jgi:hypothetical protein
VQPLAGRQLEVAKAAAGSYSMAIEDSLSAEDPDATVGQHLRQVWPKVRNSSSKASTSSLPCKLRSHGVAACRADVAWRCTAGL